MTVYETTVHTSKPPDEAFAYLSDLSRYDEWDPGTKSATQVEGTAPRVGARYELAFGRTTLCYEIAELEPPRRLRSRARNGLLTSVDTVTVEPAGGGALVTYHAELTLNGPLAVADPLLGVLFRRMGELAADGLASALGGERRT